MLRQRAFLSLSRHQLQQAGLKRVAFTRPSPSHLIGASQRSIASQSRAALPRLSQTPTWRASLLRRIRNSRSNSSKVPQQGVQEHGSPSLSARFKELSRKYGWAAVGVYLGLSALDFPFCFLAVRLIGPDRIGEVEHAIVDAFRSLVGMAVPSMRPERKVSVEELEAKGRESEAVDINGHKEKEDASIWTQLLLAYGVHKSLIFFRVPLTAAVTPKVVKTLRGWGWNIGPRTKRAAK